MDYNFFMLDQGRESGAGARMLKNINVIFLKLEKKEMLRSKLVIIFARWNEGAYWWALKEIIREHCKSEFTSCVTFSERIRLEDIHFFN
jgi:hypothetical protein